MAKRGRPPGFKATKLQAEAGSANLKKWQDEGGTKLLNVTHGAGSSTIRQKYSDHRTTEGKRLQAVIDGVVSDLGGPGALNAAQQILIGVLRAKLVVMFQLSDFMDRQDSIVDSTGSLMPCLGQNFIKYAEAIRRSLEVLYGLQRSHLRGKIPTIQDLISANAADEDNR